MPTASSGTAPRPVTQATFNFKPHPKQDAFLRMDMPFQLALMGLQTGKTTAGAFKGLIRAAEAKQILAGMQWKQEAVCLAISPTIAMGRDVLLPAYQRHLDNEPILRQALLGRGRTWDQCFLKSENRLKLLGAPFPFSLLFRSAEDGVKRLAGITNAVQAHLDEGGLYDDGPAIFNMIKNRRATMYARDRRLGQVWVTTTPVGYDWTYESLQLLAEQGNPLYGFLHGTCWDNPYRSTEELEDLWETTPPHIREQQLLAKRDTSEHSAFPGVRDSIDHHMPAQPFRTQAQDLWWKPADNYEPEPCSTGVDIAITQDFTTFVTRRIEAPHVLIAFRRFRPRNMDHLLAELKDWHGHYGGHIYADQTGIGADVVRKMRQDGLPVRGVTYTSEVRQGLITHKAILQSNGQLPSPDCEPWLREHEQFGPQPPTMRLDHPTGGHDDLVQGDALCCQGLRKGGGTITVSLR